jgi:hypothetical protein
MKQLLYPISEENFKEKVDIKFENINDGFDRFDSVMLEGLLNANTEEDIIKFLERAFELNGENNSYVDFYLSRLDEDARENLLNILNGEDKQTLKRIMEEIKDETIYFRLSREVIPLITRLSTRELFFSTFYFTKYPCTIWGNYDMKFPVFFKNKNDIVIYK